MSIKQSAFVILVAVFVFFSESARGASPSTDGFYRTGQGIQIANHWPFTIEVFAIWHDAKQVPSTKSRQAMVDLDVDKRFSLRMLRDIDADRLRAGLRDGYRRNGCSDSARVEPFLAGLAGTLPKGKALWITYDSNAKLTRLIVEGGATTTADGVEFMKATWRIWFGESKPSDLGDALLSNL